MNRQGSLQHKDKIPSSTIDVYRTQRKRHEARTHALPPRYGETSIELNWNWIQIFGSNGMLFYLFSLVLSLSDGIFFRRWKREEKQRRWQQDKSGVFTNKWNAAKPLYRCRCLAMNRARLTKREYEAPQVSSSMRLRMMFVSAFVCFCYSVDERQRLSLVFIFNHRLKRCTLFSVIQLCVCIFFVTMTFSSLFCFVRFDVVIGFCCSSSFFYSRYLFNVYTY